MNFKDINASSNPLFKDNDIIKLDDIVKIKNVIFIHDYVNKSLPLCFQSDFLKLDDAYTSVRTRNARLGCLFVPGRRSTKYGLCSIAQKCILSWNEFSKLFNCNLALVPRKKLKTRLEKHILNLY